MSTDGSTLGYAELLRLAASSGLQELESTIVQIPNEQNGHHAIILAGARTSKALYRAVGEAWRDSLPAPMRAQALTVAEQRAKIRALCEAVGMPQPLAVPESSASTAPSPSSGVINPLAGKQTSVADATVHSAGKPVEQRLAEATPRPAAPAPLRPVTAVAALQLPSTDPSPESSTPPAGPQSLSAEASAPQAADSPDEEADPTPAPRQRSQAMRSTARPAPAPPPAEGLGPDILARLLQMTRRKAVLEGSDITEEDAMRKLDSFFQRAFGHPLSEGTRMEGQRVVQRLASELARLSAESGEAAFAAG